LTTAFAPNPALEKALTQARRKVWRETICRSTLASRGKGSTAQHGVSFDQLDEP
jgi:hypothetical protein